MDPAETLVSAINSDNLAAATECLTNNPSLRSRLDDALPGLPFDGTPLLAAVWRRSKPMIDLLLAHGANINQRSHWWAGGFGVLDGDHGLADYLIERGARVDIHAASRLGRVDTIRALLSEDASRVHARGGDGQTPLHVAANVEVAAVLLATGADIDARDVDHESTPAQYAIRERQDVARFLVAHGCKTDLLMASALGDLDLVRKHLDADPRSIEMTVSAEYFPMRDPRAGGTIYIWTLGGNKSAHAIAHEFGHQAVFRLLMDRSPHELAVAAACEIRDENMVRTLLNTQPIDADRLSPRLRKRIVEAAEWCDTTAARLLLSAGWPVDPAGKHGGTPLHFAAWHGNADLARAILTRLPPLEARDRDFNMTPLGWAFHGSLHGSNRDRGDYAGTVDALLSAGAKLSTTEVPEEQASGAVRDVVRRWGERNRK